jgi:hypothetical protein
MTTRSHFFPRVHVREHPERTTVAGADWRRDWAVARARAATINEIPSNPPIPTRTGPRPNGLAEVVGERRRKGEVFEA